MVATLFSAPASTANTIANGPNFSHGPLQPLFLLRSFSTDERQTGLASHPKDTIASICLTFVLEAEDWLNHMKIKAYFSQVVEPLNRKIYCPPRPPALSRWRDLLPSFVLGPSVTANCNGLLGPSEKSSDAFIPSQSGLPYVTGYQAKWKLMLKIGFQEP